MTRAHHADVVIVGSGMGGGTLAWALRDSGARVLLLERGGSCRANRRTGAPQAVFGENRYKAKEQWRDASGGWFSPGVHYFVGGNTKVYGAALPRLRQEDFGEIQHAGVSRLAWPISYEDLAPYYDRAERLFWVHGEAGADPTDPPRSGPFPFPPMPPDPYMAELAERFRSRVCIRRRCRWVSIIGRADDASAAERATPSPAGCWQRGTPTSVLCDRRSTHPTWRSGPMRSSPGLRLMPRERATGVSRRAGWGTG